MKTNSAIDDHFANILHHLYINPLEKCNLKCKICYTRKTSPVLTEKQIHDFVQRYNENSEIQTITFCGGEVMALEYFPYLVNTLTDQGIFVQVITNGTIDKLHLFNNPNSINLIVSIDGMESYHDQNRGKGNYKKSIGYLKKAKSLGFHTEIFSIVTRQNLYSIDEFESAMENELGRIDITYHPRKPLAYLSKHPISNIAEHIEGFDFLTHEEMLRLMKTKKTFPPKELGCYQISIASDGKVFGCCEGYLPLGNIRDPIKQLTDALKNNIQGPCLGCSQSDFMCGLKDIMKNIVPYNTIG